MPLEALGARAMLGSAVHTEGVERGSSRDRLCVVSAELEHWLAPERFETTRFALRSYDVGDGPLLRDAVLESYEHLAPWLSWAKREQSEGEAECSVRRFRGRYLLGEDFTIGAFSLDGKRLLAGAGFHLREGPIASRSAEIGMWLRASEAGRGLGTEVLRALLHWGFRDWPWLRLAWRCDALNLASIRVAEKAGLRREGVLRGQPAETRAGRRDTLRFAITRDDWLGT